jgi:hypothetical protein
MYRTGLRGVGLALGLSIAVFGTAASASEPLRFLSKQYRELQAITQDFGSKTANGYFLSQGGKCHLTLMVAERINAEQHQPLSAARVRVSLSPLQHAAIDSSEGQTLSFTCSENAAVMLVEKDHYH